MDTYVHGLMLVTTTGCLWAVVAVLFGHASRQNVDIVRFMLVSTTCQAVGAWALVFHPHRLAQADGTTYAAMALVMGAAGVLSAASFQTMAGAMRMGHRGIVWAVSQSAMILPLLTGVCIFGERLRPLNWIGIAAILGGLLLLGCLRDHADPARHTRNGWMARVYAVFAMLGLSLSLVTLPSHWESFHDDAGLRIPASATGSMAFLWIQALIRRQGRWTRQTLTLGALYAGIVLLGQLFLYRSLDAMALFDRVGMVYPLALGVCVVLFSVYSAVFLREEMRGRSLVSVAGICVGLLLLAW